MPIVRVSLLDGRTLEQKKEIAREIAETLERVAGSHKEGVQVLFEDLKREDWMNGKMLFSDDPQAWQNKHHPGSA